MKSIKKKACGAKTKQGSPCRATGLPNTHRCKWHGGCSTGPRTLEGKAIALANLVQNRSKLATLFASHETEPSR